jgi:hypothetical protein
VVLSELVKEDCSPPKSIQNADALYFKKEIKIGLF